MTCAKQHHLIAIRSGLGFRRTFLPLEFKINDRTNCGLLTGGFSKKRFLIFRKRYKKVF